MIIREVMTRDVECTRPDMTIQEVAARMRSLDVGLLPVCDSDRLVGMISDRDITVRAVAEGRDPNKVCVSDVMTPGVTFCYDDQDIRQAADIMRDKQIRRLPILNRAKRLVGIISLGDIAVEVHNDPLTGNTLEGVSEPGHSR